jgi:hypothetical protein
MNTIVIRSVDKNSPFRREQRKEFEYDPGEFLFCDKAQDHIEVLLMMNHSFTVEFSTPERTEAAHFLSNMTYRAAGYRPDAAGERK